MKKRSHNLRAGILAAITLPAFLSSASAEQQLDKKETLAEQLPTAVLERGVFPDINKAGLASFWIQLGDIKLSSGVVFPVVLNFSSNFDVNSPYLGVGASFPILESNFVQVSENEWRLLQADGWTRTFRRATRGEGELIARNGWKATATEDGKAKVTSPTGWTFEYNKGTLYRLQSPLSDVLTITRNDAGLAEITHDGKSVLRATALNKDSLTSPSKILLDQKTFLVETSLIPSAALHEGQKIPFGFKTVTESVSEAKRSSLITLDYQLSEDAAAYQIQATRGTGTSRSISVDSINGHVIKDEVAEYKVDTEKADISTIHRIASATSDTARSAQKEEVKSSNLSSGETQDESIGKIVLRVTRFESGAISGYTRYASIGDGGTPKSIVQKRHYSYDENINLARINYVDSGSVIFTRDKEGTITGFSRNIADDTITKERNTDGQKYDWLTAFQ